MVVAKISIRSLARTLRVSHSSLSKAYRRGTLSRGVQLDPAGRLEVVDAAAAIAEWNHFHAPRPCMRATASRMSPPAPEPPDRWPRLSRQDLIDRWQGENTVALVLVADVVERADAADRAAAVDRLAAAIATLAAELDDPAIERDALVALRHHVASLDLDELEVAELLARLDARPSSVA